MSPLAPSTTTDGAPAGKTPIQTVSPPTPDQSHVQSKPTTPPQTIIISLDDSSSSDSEIEVLSLVKSLNHRRSPPTLTPSKTPTARATGLTTNTRGTITAPPLPPENYALPGDRRTQQRSRTSQQEHGRRPRHHVGISATQGEINPQDADQDPSLATEDEVPS